MEYKKIRKRAAAFVLLISLLLGTSITLVSGATLPPKPLSPKGDITDTTPTYKWKPVAGATLYRMQVLKDGNPVFYEDIDTSVCTATKCAHTPSNALEFAEHKWRVQAYESNTWTGYSSKKTFTVIDQPPGFKSKFTSDANGWKKYLGQWSLNSGTYYTVGKPDKSSSAGYTTNYWNFVYKVMIKRNGCDYCQNGLYIRGVPKPLGTGSFWQSGYSFQITNDDRYAVYRHDAGNPTILKSWTSTAHLNAFDWNTLKVIAKGKILKYYLNGNLVWKGKDTTYSKGYVGVFMEQRSSTSEQFWVDWANLSTDLR